jgi:type IV secretion system protein VirD4
MNQKLKTVHFVLDESASLGHLDAIDDAVDKFRGFGVRLIFAYQSLGQLKKCFPNGQDQTLLSNTTQIFFGVNDQGLPGGVGTADYVSARLGEKTIAVKSGGTSTGRSTQWSGSASQHSSGGGRSRNANDNWGLQARKLLKPEEVIALPPRVAITFTPGVPPICTELIRYYEQDHMGASPGFFKQALIASKTLTLALSVLAFALSLWIAVRVTQQACEARAGLQPAARQTDQQVISATQRPGVPAD